MLSASPSAGTVLRPRFSQKSVGEPGSENDIRKKPCEAWRRLEKVGAGAMGRRFPRELGAPRKRERRGAKPDDFAIPVTGKGRGCSVERVAFDGRAKKGKLSANLVLAAGHRCNVDDEASALRATSKDMEYALAGVRGRRTFDEIRSASAPSLPVAISPRRDGPMDDGFVAFLHLAGFERASERPPEFEVPREEAQSARSDVEAVTDEELFAKPLFDGDEQVLDGVVAGWMHGQSCGLVYEDIVRGLLDQARLREPAKSPRSNVDPDKRASLGDRRFRRPSTGNVHRAETQ